MLALLAAVAFLIAGCATSGSFDEDDSATLIVAQKQQEAAVGRAGQKMPDPQAALLVCDGKCLVKSKGVSLQAGDQARIAVDDDKNSFRVYIGEGSVDFVITNWQRTIVLSTPWSDNILKGAETDRDGVETVHGSVTVDGGGRVEIAVSVGQLAIATPEGTQMTDASKKVVLIADPLSD
jgi:hypothetical protein